MDADEIRLAEYEKAIDLYASEDETAWVLVSVWIALQTALFSAGVSLYASKATGSALWLPGLCLAGGLSSLFWWFILFRSKMWRDNWYFYGQRLERQFREIYGVPGMFEFMDRVKNKIALESYRGQIRERAQHVLERTAVLKYMHHVMLVLAIIWGALIVAFLIARP